MGWDGNSSADPVTTLTSVTSNSAATSGTTVATAPSVTLEGLTMVEVTFSWNNTVHSTNDPFAVVLRDNGSQLAQFQLDLSGNGGGGQVRWVGTPSAGAHVFTAALTRISGTGTTQLIASVTAPAQLLTQRVPT